MPAGFAWDIHNGYIKKDIKTGLGVIKQRSGIKKFNTVDFTDICKFIYEAKWNGGGKDVIIRKGTGWYKWDGVDSFDSLDTGRTDGVRGQAVMFDNELIMADGGLLRKCTSAYSVSNLLPAGGVKTVSVNTQGSGYYIGDILEIIQSGVAEDDRAEVTVVTVDNFGAVLTVEVTKAGKTHSVDTGLSTSVQENSGAIRGTVSIASGGSGYVVGEILTIAGGTGGTVKVTTVSSGVVTAIELLTAGHNYTAESGLTTTSDKDGTGCTLTISATGGSGCLISITALHDDDQPSHVSAVHVHNHKVWCNDDDNPMEARYLKTDSANQADSFVAENDAGILDFSTILPNGDKLLGFATFAEKFLVFIFTRYAVIYDAGTDPTAFNLRQIIPLNCISGHGVKQVGNDLAVCSLEGVNSFRSSLANQDLDIDDLSKYIAPLYRELIGQTTSTEDVSVGFSHDLNHLYIGIPALEHTILVYSVDIQNFVGRWTGYDCYCFCERLDGTMLIGGEGYIYEMNVNTNDDGEVISFQYDFGALYAKSGGQNKSFRQFEGLVTHEGSPILTLGYSYVTLNLSDVKTPITIPLASEGVEWDSTEAVWDSASWAGSTAERILSSNLLGRGKALLLSLSNNVLDSSVEIPYLILRYKREGIKIR